MLDDEDGYPIPPPDADEIDFTEFEPRHVTVETEYTEIRDMNGDLIARVPTAQIRTESAPVTPPSPS